MTYCRTEYVGLVLYERRNDINSSFRFVSESTRQANTASATFADAVVISTFLEAVLIFKFKMK